MAYRLGETFSLQDEQLFEEEDDDGDSKKGSSPARVQHSRQEPVK